jgi:hypothetical protein
MPGATATATTTSSATATTHNGKCDVTAPQSKKLRLHHPCRRRGSRVVMVVVVLVMVVESVVVIVRKTHIGDESIHRHPRQSLLRWATSIHVGDHPPKNGAFKSRHVIRCLTAQFTEQYVMYVCDVRPNEVSTGCIRTEYYNESVDPP